MPKSDNTKNATKSSITQRLGTNLGRSVGVITTTQHIEIIRGFWKVHDDVQPTTEWLCCMPAGYTYVSEHLVSSLFGIALICLIFRKQLSSQNLSWFSRLFTSNIPLFSSFYLNSTITEFAPETNNWNEITNER